MRFYPFSRLINLKTAVLFCFMMMGFACSKNFVYHPEKELIATPADAALPFEDLDLTTEDGIRINGWFVPFQGSEGVLLWFHGNAGNMGNRVDLLQRLNEELKLNILMIDYRGYGKSEGEVSEEGTAKDALAAYDYLLSRPDIHPERIFVFGQSLGAAVAVRLSTESRVGGLILEAPFTSVKALTAEIFPWLPFKGLISIKYDSMGKIKSVQSPLLVMHGDQDKVVPYEQGQQIFEAANTPKTFYTITGADHNNAYVVGGPGYFEAMKRFIEGIQP